MIMPLPFDFKIYSLRDDTEDNVSISPLLNNTKYTQTITTNSINKRYVSLYNLDFLRYLNIDAIPNNIKPTISNPNFKYAKDWYFRYLKANDKVIDGYNTVKSQLNAILSPKK